MIAGGIHSSLKEPRTSSMFARAGKGSSTAKKKDESSSSMAEAFTQAAVVISTAFTMLNHSIKSMHRNEYYSPAKLTDARSKCYKQLHDLNSLKAAGVLDDEYSEEKEAVLGVLRKLKGN